MTIHLDRAGEFLSREDIEKLVTKRLTKDISDAVQEEINRQQKEITIERLHSRVMDAAETMKEMERLGAGVRMDKYVAIVNQSAKYHEMLLKFYNLLRPLFAPEDEDE